MMKAYSCCLVLIVAAAMLVETVSAQAAETIKGELFLDANANGRRDTGEEGLGGVHATNGHTFVTTDADGTFTIDWVRGPVLRDGGTPTVSVRIPDGYWPTTPWFRRVPRPADGQQLEFGLRRDSQSLPFTFIHATDCHVPRKGVNRFLTFRNNVTELADQMRFCILTGDLADLSDSHSFAEAIREFEFFAEQTRGFPIPLFCLSGNHDIAGVRAKSGWEPKSPYYGYGFFTYRVGPLRWSFTYAGVHFVGVDFNRLVDGKWEWGVPTSAARWLAADLELVQPGTRILLFVHFPQGSDAFGEVVNQYHVTQIFHGHDHVDRAKRFAGTPCLSSGSVAEIFSDKDRRPGFRVVHVTADEIETFYQATGGRHAITIDAPRSGETLKPGDTIRGGFLDPDGVIKRLTIRVGEHEEKVPFERGPLCCRFNAVVNLSDVAAGTRQVTVSIAGGGVRRDVKVPALVVTERAANADHDDHADNDQGDRAGSVNRTSILLRSTCRQLCYRLLASNHLLTSNLTGWRSAASCWANRSNRTTSRSFSGGRQTARVCMGSAHPPK